MPGFDLVPVDGGGPVRLPEGQTVLGRGPFLGISDKRVSRHHGLLENLDGKLRIKPTHLNPCFSQASLSEDPQPLERECWCPLRPGDFFSLLPRKYIYKVVVTGDSTLRNSQVFQEEEEFPKTLPVSPEPDIELPPAGRDQGRTPPPIARDQGRTPPPIARDQGRTPPPIARDQGRTPPPIGRDQGRTPPPIGRDQGRTPPTEEPTLAAVDNNQEEANNPNRTSNKGATAPSKEVKDDQNGVSPPVPKKRVLPAWMTSAVASPKSPSSTPKGAGKKGKGPATPATSANVGVPNQTRPTTAISPEDSEHSEVEDTPRKKRRRRKMSEEDGEAKTAPKARQQREESEESDSFDMEVQEGGKGVETSTANRDAATPTADKHESDNEGRKSKNGQMAKRAEPPGSSGGSVSGPAPSTARLRTPCPYGKDCYRKNPIHFQESSHPGDSDYEEEEEEEEEDRPADRPECPYGTDCYRKNPLHRKEYKHTKRPARSTRTVPRRTAGDEDEDDDFGDDDSFINDDSEDVGDDLDYVPPDSDDSGKEDIKRLQMEAKAFQQRRK